MSEYEKEFIKRVRKEIATLGLTLDAAGKAIGLTRQGLSRILNGKVDSMRADTMLKLARLFCISIDEIVDDMTLTGVLFPKATSEAQKAEIERRRMIAKRYNDKLVKLQERGVFGR